MRKFEEMNNLLIGLVERKLREIKIGQKLFFSYYVL